MMKRTRKRRTRRKRTRTKKRRTVMVQVCGIFVFALLSPLCASPYPVLTASKFFGGCFSIMRWTREVLTCKQTPPQLPRSANWQSLRKATFPSKLPTLLLLKQAVQTLRMRT